MKRLFALLILTSISVTSFGQVSQQIECNGFDSLYNAKDYQGVIRKASTAIENQSNCTYAFFFRGSAKYAIEDYQGAIKDLDAYVRSANATTNLLRDSDVLIGACDLKLGDHTNACLYFKKAANLGDEYSRQAVKDLCQ